MYVKHSKLSKREQERLMEYFGGVRKGKRGRGAAGKIPVFGILKRGGKVYTQVINDTKSDALMPIILDKSSLTS